MFHYSGRPISRQAMTEMLADRHAAIALEKMKRERERDDEAVKQKRAEFIFGCLISSLAGIGAGHVVLAMMEVMM